MSRHKHKKPRVKVYFRHKGHLFRLLEAINFGSKSSPELKIKGLTETYMQIKDDQKRFDGNLHEGQLVRFVDGDHMEFTYHKDGAILAETIHPSGEKEHDNVYNEGEVWTPIGEIATFQPVMILLISSLESYHYAFPEEKYGLINYIVRNDKLFELSNGQGVMVLIYIRHKDYPIAKYCFDGRIYSDVLMRFGDQLELCILIQKQKHPDFGGAMIKNEFRFVDKVDGFEYLNRELKDHIFSQTFANFLKPLQEGDCYFDVSEKMIMVIDSVDPLYIALFSKGVLKGVPKSMLVRRLLDTLDGKYDEFLLLSEKDRMKRVIALYAEMLEEEQKE